MKTEVKTTTFLEERKTDNRGFLYSHSKYL